MGIFFVQLNFLSRVIRSICHRGNGGIKIALFTLALCTPLGANAERTSSTATEKLTAEEHFDLGVRHFEDSQFEASARAFLRADLQDPASDTLSNALIAAQKSGSHLLVVQVAERALQREDSDPGLVVKARDALAESSPHLALLRLSCSPAPCEVYVDEQVVPKMDMYVLPGTHKVRATFSGKTPLRSEEEDATLKAGTTYKYQLIPQKQQASIASSDTPPAHKSTNSKPHEWKKTIGRPVFYGAVATTAVLVGVTTWSGLAATQSVKKVEEPGNSDDQELRKSANNAIIRTDVLLSSSIVSGIFTLAWGIWGTDFNKKEKDFSLKIVPTGLGLNAQGSF